MPFNLTGQQASSGHQPGTPTIGTATAGDGSATVTFTAPTYLGKPIGTTYTATSTPGGITGTGSSSPISITGLTNGDTVVFETLLTRAIAGDNVTCPSVGFGCTYTHNFVGSTYVYLTVDGSQAC